MNAKKQNHIIRIFFISTLFLFSSLFGVSLSPTAYASPDADKKATEECSHISGADQLATERRAACHKGFVAGYDGGKTKAAACAGLTSTPRNNCYDGFDAGKAAKEKAPEVAGREGAKAKKSKTESCKKFKNPANKKTCEKAYDNQILAMAQAAGKKAGREGKPSPCENLGYGGHKDVAACKKAYLKGKNEAGRGARNKCGDVATYFDFKETCKDADGNEVNTKEGGNRSPIVAIGLAIVGWVSALVAVAVVGGIIYGGFLYLTARDNSGQTQKGVVVITNSVAALIAWGFAYALINFIVPGGLFNG